MNSNWKHLGSIGSSIRKLSIYIAFNLRGSLLCRDFVVDSLQIVALTSFAFAQPLFALLFANAEFFVIRKSEAEIVGDGRN